MTDHGARVAGDQVHQPRHEAAPAAAESHPLGMVNHDTIQAARACANSSLPDAQRAVDSKIGSCQIVHDGSTASHSVFRDATGALQQLSATDGQGGSLQFTRKGSGDQWTVDAAGKSDRIGGQMTVSDVQVSPDGKSFSFTGSRGEHVTSDEHGTRIETREGRVILQGTSGTSELPSPAEREQGFLTTRHYTDGRMQVVGKGTQLLTVNPDGTGKMVFSDGFEKQINPPYSADEMKMFNHSTIGRLTELPDHRFKVEMKQLADPPKQ